MRKIILPFILISSAFGHASLDFNQTSTLSHDVAILFPYEQHDNFPLIPARLTNSSLTTNAPTVLIPESIFPLDLFGDLYDTSSDICGGNVAAVFNQNLKKDLNQRFSGRNRYFLHAIRIDPNSILHGQTGVFQIRLSLEKHSKSNLFQDDALHLSYNLGRLVEKKTCGSDSLCSSAVSILKKFKYLAQKSTSTNALHPAFSSESEIDIKELRSFTNELLNKLATPDTLVEIARSRIENTNRRQWWKFGAIHNESGVWAHKPIIGHTQIMQELQHISHGDEQVSCIKLDQPQSGSAQKIKSLVEQHKLHPGTKEPIPGAQALLSEISTTKAHTGNTDCISCHLAPTIRFKGAQNNDLPSYFKPYAMKNGGTSLRFFGYSLIPGQGVVPTVAPRVIGEAEISSQVLSKWLKNFPDEDETDIHGL